MGRAKDSHENDFYSRGRAESCNIFRDQFEFKMDNLARFMTDLPRNSFEKFFKSLTYFNYIKKYISLN